MTTCLINDQINDKRKMSILSEDTLLESGKLLKKFHICCELDSMSELSGFVYIKNHVILHVKSKAQKVNLVALLFVDIELNKSTSER